MKMYHAAQLSDLESIQADGLRAPVYMTPELTTAENYGFANSDSTVIFEINIDESLFHADSEFVKNAGEDFRDSENPVLAESLSNGSVWVSNMVPVTNAILRIYEDYDLVE